MMNEYEKSFDKLIPKSDLEDQAMKNDAIQESLTTIGDALSQASQLLDDLENDGVLGPAIRRYATDLANEIGKVATDLDHGSDENEKREWARALLKDAHSELSLEEETGEEKVGGNGVIITSMTATDADTDVDVSAAKAISKLSENDLINAMTAARTVLLDVEDALRSIGEDEADEIADVGLIVAKMFLWALQNIHSKVTPDMLQNPGAHAARSRSTMDIEILDDNDDQDNVRQKPSNTKGGHTEAGRLRILWPPIGPAVLKVASWGKDEAVKSPILSIVLGMVLWPAALIGTFIGGPILATDWCLQSGYNAVKDQPIMETAEKGAANLYQVGRFYFLISKLMLKQSIRVGKRQIERRGGMHQVAKDIGDFAIDRALHPIESAGMLWNSAKWGAGLVVDGVRFAKDVSNGENRANANLM